MNVDGHMNNILSTLEIIGRSLEKEDIDTRNMVEYAVAKEALRNYQNVINKKLGEGSR